MRILLALPDSEMMVLIQQILETIENRDVIIAENGADVLQKLRTDHYDVLLLHACLPVIDGLTVGKTLVSLRLICPPRIMLLCPHEYCISPEWADCVLSSGVSIGRLCAFLEILMQKPLPVLAAVNRAAVSQTVMHFLQELHFEEKLKGRSYAAWLLERLIPSPITEQLPTGELYLSCARFFRTTPSAVERCLRTAVESIFTNGSIHSIERFFGCTIDPEKGKLTNRAFLIQSAQLLRTCVIL